MIHPQQYGVKPSVDISVVIPVYRSRESLEELARRLKETLSRVVDSFEIFFVNDGSPDDAWDVIRKLAALDQRIKGINLSRNFGQHRAITAGLDFVCGDRVVVMDCDLQDVPEEIPKMLAKSREGYDVVVGRRVHRNDVVLKRAQSYLFSRLFSFLSGAKVDSRESNFGVYSRKVIDAVRAMREQNRSFGMFIRWVGFSRAEVDIEHALRPHGKTSYTLGRALALATDSIVAYSNKLLTISVHLGIGISILSLAYAVFLAIQYFFNARPVEGWTSLIVSIYFTTGLILASTGVLGLYLGKVFDEVKGRPLYIIESTTFDSAKEG